jgi:hypothetical protein
MNRDFILSNCDTDSISFCKKDMTPFTEEERNLILEEINSQMPELVKYADDGYYETLVVLKAKNYIMYDGKKVKLKGSAIKDQKKELALREMVSRMIESILGLNSQSLPSIYHEYIREAMNPTDIKRWSSKRTVTKPILDCKGYTEEDITSKRIRRNETVVWDAVKDIRDLQEGNKVYLYPCVFESRTEVTHLKNGKIKEKTINSTGLKVCDDWDGSSKSVDTNKLVERVVATVDIFANILEKDTFIDYSLQKNKYLLKDL